MNVTILSTTMVYVKWEKPKRFYKMIDKYTIEFWSKSGEIYGKRETGGGDYEVGLVLLDFSLTVKVAPHECVIRTSQP